jgi:hypothetical protein
MKKRPREKCMDWVQVREAWPAIMNEAFKFCQSWDKIDSPFSFEDMQHLENFIEFIDKAFSEGKEVRLYPWTGFDYEAVKKDKEERYARRKKDSTEVPTMRDAAGESTPHQANRR